MGLFPAYAGVILVNAIRDCIGRSFPAYAGVILIQAIDVTITAPFSPHTRGYPESTVYAT